MSLNTFINSRVGFALGMGLSRMPAVAGYAVARWIGTWIASRKSDPAVRAVRANHWVLRGERPDDNGLDRIVTATYQSAARSLYEFWHFWPDHEAVKKMVKFDASFTAAFERSRKSHSGLLLVVPHLSNFDLIGRSAVLNGYPLHVLSYPQPPGHYRWQNRLRELPGLMVTPFSTSGLRQASITLQNGGTVLTGIDRPLSDPQGKYLPHFFGRQVSLPVFHIRLALKQNLPIVVVGGERKPDGTYLAWASDPIPMQPHADLVREIVQNAESVLEVLARTILRAPDQWAMFYPVWPEVIDKVPRIGRDAARR